MNNIETMKLALEALDLDNPDIQLRAAIALRQAIEQAQQAEPTSGDYALGYSIGFGEGHSAKEAIEQAEPVACGYDETTGNCTNNPCCYTSPPPRQPLTDEEIAELWLDIQVNTPASGVHEEGLQPWRFARAIEAAHGIKEKNNV